MRASGGSDSANPGPLSGGAPLHLPGSQSQPPEYIRTEDPNVNKHSGLDFYNGEIGKQMPYTYTLVRFT